MVERSHELPETVAEPVGARGEGESTTGPREVDWGSSIRDHSSFRGRNRKN